MEKTTPTPPHKPTEQRPSVQFPDGGRIWAEPRPDWSKRVEALRAAIQRGTHKPLQRKRGRMESREDAANRIASLQGKQSKPEKDPAWDGVWRIRRHDGELVGAYVSRMLAQEAINNAAYLK